MDYQLIWVLGRFAANLADCRQAFHDAAAEYNEAEGMPRGLLLTPVSFEFVPPARRAAADSNIRMCRYLVLAAEDSRDAPLAGFGHDYNLALACKEAPDLPLREIVAMFRRQPGGDGRLAAFRHALDPGVRQFYFSDAAEFKALVAELFSEWMQSP